MGRGSAVTAHATELQPGFCSVVQSPGLFCISCAFSRLSQALPVSDLGRSFYLLGERRGLGAELSREAEATQGGEKGVDDAGFHSFP